MSGMVTDDGGHLVPCSTFLPQHAFQPSINGRFFLISSAVESNSQQSHVSNPAFKTPLTVTQEPAAFKARRRALNLSTAKLASILGISSADVEVIEAIPLGEEVAFLHNFTLSLIELGAIDTQNS